MQKRLNGLGLTRNRVIVVMLVNIIKHSALLDLPPYTIYALT